MGENAAINRRPLYLPVEITALDVLLDARRGQFLNIIGFRFIKLYLNGKYYFTLFIVKPILNTFLFLLIFAVLSQCRKEVEPPTVTIPDDNFLNALIELGVDTDGDGVISPAEAEVIISLDVSEKGISDMTGIEAFVNLDTLCCYLNPLTSLDASSIIKLKYLDCRGCGLKTINVSNCIDLTDLDCGSIFDSYSNWINNQLTNLEVSNNTALVYLNCGSNQLTVIDVSNNTALEWLICDDNPLTTLDIINNPALIFLWCSNTLLSFLDISNNADLHGLYCHNSQLSTLDISNNIVLELLNLRNNQLSTLNVSNNTELLSLDCMANQLTNLDVSNNTKLFNLACSDNQLTSLDVSKNIDLLRMDLWNMPSLNKVCVWELPFPPPRIQVDTTGSPNVYFTTDCN